MEYFNPFPHGLFMQVKGMVEGEYYPHPNPSSQTEYAGQQIFRAAKISMTCYRWWAQGVVRRVEDFI